MTKLRWEKTENGKAYLKKLRSTPEYRAKIKTYQDAHKKEHSLRQIKYMAKPKIANVYKKRSIFGQITRSIVDYKQTGCSAEDFIGCSPESFAKHIEQQFDSKMNWNNYGTRGWHMDHIKPVRDFDLCDPKQVLECFHYTNIRPLWGHINMNWRSLP
jgi:hypothetical protein